eukprot:TRINITY_DN18282_c0_g1_i3.p1 TRINITY_DN18282_c0_g1~~TRINITY_DN18282_c0_g1_i3.p1  ORF type:complete len:584 (+),score=128.94 TRINITY_DN18282_c0_g1_i3:113-1864(+)
MGCSMSTRFLSPEAVVVEIPPSGVAPTLLTQQHGPEGKGRRAGCSSARRRTLRQAAASSQVSENCKNVLDRYAMSLLDEDFIGEGSSSTCRKGQTLDTNVPVAIKVYKHKVVSTNDEAPGLERFSRHVAILQALHEPFRVPMDDHLWCEDLMSAEPSRLFVVLLDHSKTFDEQPGPSPADATCYLVLELGQQTLKEYLEYRKEQRRPLGRDLIRTFAKAIVLAVAGLHAKGFVHLDLQPENLMMFDGLVKLADVGRCTTLGSRISIASSEIAFSPCYCAPEWARFLIEEEAHSNCDGIFVTAKPHLDVWSVGMTICELVTLERVLGRRRASFLQDTISKQDAGFLFLQWLADIEQGWRPQAMEKRQHEELRELLQQKLLVCDPHARCTLAGSLSHPFFTGLGRSKSRSRVSVDSMESVVALDSVAAVKQRRKCRETFGGEDVTMQKPTSICIPQKAILWKLMTDSYARDPACWEELNMWMNDIGTVFYSSPVELRKTTVLFHGGALYGATIRRVYGHVLGVNHLFEYRNVLEDVARCLDEFLEGGADSKDTPTTSNIMPFLKLCSLRYLSDRSIRFNGLTFEA